RRPPPSTPFPYTTLFRSLSHPRNRQLQKVAVFTLPNVNFWKRQAESQSTSIHQLKVWRKEVVKQTVKSSLGFCSNECHIVYSLLDRKSTRLNSSHVKISY